MPHFDHANKTVLFKIVYHGPGLAGRTTNMMWVHQRTAPDARGAMTSSEYAHGHALSFELTPRSLGRVHGFDVRLSLLSAPGALCHNPTHTLILKDADGVVFVADSQTARREANIESLEHLADDLKVCGRDPRQVPTVLQYNKRDLPEIAPVDAMDVELNPRGLCRVEAIASHGTGVFDTLRQCATLVTVRADEAGPWPPYR